MTPSLNSTPGTYTCIEPDCGRAFDITQADIERCRENHWQPPLRCRACRDKRRNLSTKDPQQVSFDAYEKIERVLEEATRLGKEV